jgi:hypothetical protein
MTKTEFSRALALAQSDVDLGTVDFLPNGYGTRDVKSFPATIEMIAKELRWRCRMLNGFWNREEIAESMEVMRRKVALVGVGSDEGQNIWERLVEEKVMR